MRARSVVAQMWVNLEEKDAAHGIAFPWWIPVFCLAGQTVSILVALAQRDRLTLPYVALMTILVTVPACVMLFSRWWVPWWAEAIAVFSGIAVVLSFPSGGQGAADAVSMVLIFVVGKYTAVEGFRIGAVATGISAAMLLVASAAGHLQLVGVHLLMVAFGLTVGYMLHAQSRALAAEREARAAEHVRATMAERDRIAREIHDLVAHSLSVTMLHVTGARRILTDSTGSTDASDVEEAIEALRDAERVGRQAMAEIRQTVSELATEGDPHRPLPSADDLPELVDRVRSAGLKASYDAHGDIGRLPPALGLGVYRVVQESLTNVTKHAPGSPAHVSLAAGRSDVRLTVRSTRTTPHSQPDDTGSGITGMKARVAQLGGTLDAGPSGDAWVVEAVLPLTAEDDPHSCAVSRTISGLTEPRVEEATT